MNDFLEESGAHFSHCRNYRYMLWRVWDKSKPTIMFIGLNPSTANESKDDPTINRVKKIASNLGFGGVWMMNLFAIVSSDPKVLKTCKNPVGDNDYYLNLTAKECSKVVFAWGNFKEAEERSKEVAAMFPEAYALHINKNGSPKHPLYCKADTQLVKFN